MTAPERLDAEKDVTAGSSSLLEIQDLYKAFGSNEVIRGLSLRVEQGTIMGLAGGNGAGKTTVFNVVAGAIKSDRGHILFDGGDLIGLPPWQINKLGLSRTFQDLRVFGAMTVVDNLMVAAEKALLGFRKSPRVSAAVDIILAEVGLENKRDHIARELSYAEQKFLTIGRALVQAPRLLLLDEPASGLDSLSMDRLKDLVRARGKSGTTVVVVEHNLEFLRDLVDQLAFLDLGAVRAVGTAKDIMSRPDLAEAYFGG